MTSRRSEVNIYIYMYTIANIQIHICEPLRAWTMDCAGKSACKSVYIYVYIDTLMRILALMYVFPHKEIDVCIGMCVCVHVCARVRILVHGRCYLPLDTYGNKFMYKLIWKWCLPIAFFVPCCRVYIHLQKTKDVRRSNASLHRNWNAKFTPQAC